jgi:hypothetical protein
LFGLRKGIDWVLSRWSSFKEAQTKCLTSH